MSFFKRLSPFQAFRDLRQFVTTRKKHELWLLLPAALITAVILWGFMKDSTIEPEWKRPEIQWVQSWPLDRSDAEIRAQQEIDKIEKAKREAELAKKQKERREEFKKVDDSLKSLGL